jgi:probable rRNA maturation factor
MKRVWIRNRQRLRRINVRLLRHLTRYLLEECLEHPSFELALHLVSSTEMARLNQTFLQHTGPTDVITFNNRELETGPFLRPGADAAPPGLAGEIFLCPEIALQQAREFGVSWQSELARYVVHGVLHLEGHDDLEAAARRKMKRVENRLVSALAASFPLSKLGQEPRLAA